MTSIFIFGKSECMENDIITFNPGPSQLSLDIILGIQELATNGFLSLSHRSTAFKEISRQAIQGLHLKMGIPDDYKIFYQPSATVAMDTLIRNVVRQKSFHFVHGAFSALFHHIALGIGISAVDYKKPLDVPIDWENALVPEDTELIAVTHNETSTGLMWPRDELKNLRKRYSKPLLAIDVTSSFGCMKMDWQGADIWFGSVQKCLGLPSGLGFLIVSPRAFEKSKGAKGVVSWNGFSSLDEKMKTYETPETPNMLNIALLARQMSHWDLNKIEAELMQKAHLLYHADLNWKPHIASESWRSPTVTCFIVDNAEAWHARAKASKMVLGKGYGPIKETTLRIANFPAITREHVIALLKILV